MSQVIACGAQSLVFCVVFCESLFIILYFFFWSLHCLSYSDLRLLINPWYLFFSPLVEFVSEDFFLCLSDLDLHKENQRTNNALPKKNRLTSPMADGREPYF